MRHHTNKLAELEYASEDLQKPHQHHSHKQILDTVIGDQCHHHHRQCTSSTRDHTRTTANTCGDQAHHKGGIETDQWINTGDKGKGYCLWHQCQGNGKTG